MTGGMRWVLVDDGRSFEDSDDGLICLFPRVDFGFGIDGTETEVPCPQMIDIKRCPRKLCLDILLALESATHLRELIPNNPNEANQRIRLRPGDDEALVR